MFPAPSGQAHSAKRPNRAALYDADVTVATDVPGLRPRGTATGQRIWVYLSLATVSLINLISNAPLQPNAHQNAWGDAINYYAMSEHTGAKVDNPFALRMLSPWLAHMVNQVTGVALDHVWLGLTLLFTLAATIVFFEFLWSHLKLQLFTSSLAAVALACTFWYAPYAFSNPYLVDPLNNLLYLVALWLLFRQRLVLFTIVIVVGSINKETTLLLAPLYPLLAWTRSRSFKDRQVLFGGLAVVGAAILYFVFRIWAQNLIGADYSLGSGQANTGLLNNIVFALSSNKGNEPGALWGTFYFFWVLFAYGLYLEYRERGLRSELLTASLWLLACCMAGRLVATDTQRVFVMLAPLVIGLAAVVLDSRRGEARRLWVGLLVFVYVALNLRWVPAGASFAVEAGALALFAALMFPPSRPPWRRPGQDGSVTEEFVPHRGSLGQN